LCFTFPVDIYMFPCPHSKLHQMAVGAIENLHFCLILANLMLLHDRFTLFRNPVDVTVMGPQRLVYFDVCSDLILLFYLL
jgi:hypothetical protein